MQNFSSYGTPQRALPRPTSSGTLLDSYDDANVKRQRMNPPPPMPYAPPSNFQTFGAISQYEQPYGHGMPPVQSTQTWNAQPYYPPNETYSTSSYNGPHQNIAPSLPKESKPVIEKVEEHPIVKTNAVDYGKEGQVDSSEEESEHENVKEAQSETKRPITVPGTSITLATQADIEKWRSERKKMWLLKISNKKLEHMNSMGIKESEVKAQKSVLQESKKQKQFIQSIQNQVNRVNPKSNLNVRIVQREMAKENSKLLQFIKELGDANLLKYELTQQEKDKLFGGSDFNSKDQMGDKKGRQYGKNGNNGINQNERRYTNRKPNYHHR
ncbi:hypothetical protein HG535_0H04100 [Zygotorulaspora mrakii]|uniref:FMR1-interacting protein 1 conserved domain-containing protein n=1 Tax=Zygotorulaspora mrakii TaxID=42260 RepID=A0A7H9B968_ZYGMR|nr:uncharacterized protein HG535_0H04100 [Zygotorulaspora mrakii]QLG75083.1 hypothetical protein HG535_0H04100 [Zygotorulaspora mrakii]